MGILHRGGEEHEGVVRAAFPRVWISGAGVQVCFYGGLGMLVPFNKAHLWVSPLSCYALDFLLVVCNLSSGGNFIPAPKPGIFTPSLFILLVQDFVERLVVVAGVLFLERNQSHVRYIWNMPVFCFSCRCGSR